MLITVTYLHSTARELWPKYQISFDTVNCKLIMEQDSESSREKTLEKKHHLMHARERGKKRKEGEREKIIETNAYN